MSDNKNTVWTVMVYLAGDNNLSEEMIYAIKEMYRIGVVRDIDMIIQFDPSGIGPRVRRYDIGNFKKNRQVIDADAKERRIPAVAADNKVDIDGKLEDLRDDDFERDAGRLRRRLNPSSTENSSDPRVLRDFIIDSIKLKAHDRSTHVTHYMVVLSGHGNGAEGDFLTDRDLGVPPGPSVPPVQSVPSVPPVRSVPPGSLSIPHLRWVFSEVKAKSEALGGEDIDVLGMDSCLMSTTEVCYQVREYVKFLVGAEGFEPNTGWPYHRILEMLRDTDDEENVAYKIVDIYSRYYRDYEVAGASTDQAACNVKKLADLLVPRVGELAQELESGLVYRAIKDGILLAHWEAQSYKGEQYVDLFDFCDRLQIRCEAERDALKAKQDALKAKQNLQKDLQSDVEEQLDSSQEYRLKALKALHLTPLKEEHYTPAWQLLYDQLGSEQQELMHAWRNNDIAGVRRALYMQLEPQDRKVTDVLVEQQPNAELKQVGRSLLDQLYPKNLKVNYLIDLLELQPLETAGEFLLNQLEPEHRPLMSALKAQDAQAVRKALYDQLDSKQKEFIAALEQNNLAEAWALLRNQLNAIADACRRVKGAIEGDGDTPGVVLNSCYTGPAFQHSHGLSVYFPWFEEKKVLDEYETLDFAMDTGWAKFLRKYLRATRRRRRNQEGHLGQIPVRIDPPESAVVASFIPRLRSSIDERGLGFGTGGMKNPPDGFYPGECNSKK